MKEKTKELDIVFVLDKSGSMSGSEKDTIGGYNSFLEKERKNNPKSKVTTVLFDTCTFKDIEKKLEEVI